MKNLTGLVILFVLLAGCKHKPDLNIYFGETEGCFVVYDMQDEVYHKVNPERCAERFTPCSTFKIPNSLIALNEKLFENVDSVVVWDSTLHPKQSHWPKRWSKNHNLHSAFQNSVVWFYQEIAKKIGKEKYSEYLKKFKYGNQDLAGRADLFWLSSSLKISADEQVSFLKNLYKNSLNFNDYDIETVKDLMVLEDTGVYTLYGKTGAGPLPDGNWIGWLVGFVENDKGLYFYALNIEGKTYKEISGKRIKLAKKLLKATEALPRAY